MSILSFLIFGKGGIDMKDYLREMRVHHYIKNLLVLAPLVCSGQFFSEVKLFYATMGFVSFCMISSIVYVLNDIKDVEKDRKHPIKCNRPIAAGKISEKKAVILIATLSFIAVIGSIFIHNIVSSILLMFYLFINILYSLGLKNVPIVDIAILVSGFVLRVIYGAFITDIQISNWLYLVVIAAAFYFVLGKRRNELKKISSSNSRKVLRYYTESYLDKNMYMYLALIHIFYALWCTDEKTVKAYNNHYLLWTVPIVLIIMMRYSLVVERDSDGDPIEVLIHDKILVILVFVYLLIMLYLLYAV